MARSVKIKDVEVERLRCRGKATGKNSQKKSWESPKLDDVSGKIMAQPYIRFT